MLVLTRRDGDKITIGQDITITVVECRRSFDGSMSVRFGIDCPRDLEVHRVDRGRKTEGGEA